MVAAQRLALQRLQRERFTTLYNTLREDTTETIPNEQLEFLGMARGSPLDVDNLGEPNQRDISCQFFSPYDWTQSSLDWESDSGSIDSEWMGFTHCETFLWRLLDATVFRFVWFKTRLLNLESIEQNVWEPAFREEERRSLMACLREEIKESIGLDLPQVECICQTLPGVDHIYTGTWAYFAAPAADKPHSVCVMLDSMSPSDGIATRSEVEAAVRMTEFQLQRACFSHHCVKPALICTYFRNETARITQAHFDVKLDRLILRQSRVLNLSGPATPPDAWLMLRWMASSPVGPTLYEPSTSLPEATSEDGAGRPPQLTVAG